MPSDSSQPVAAKSLASEPRFIVHLALVTSIARSVPMIFVSPHATFLFKTHDQHAMYITRGGPSRCVRYAKYAKIGDKVAFDGERMVRSCWGERIDPIRERGDRFVHVKGRIGVRDLTYRL